MGGGGGGKGLITRKCIKNTLLYLSPREVRLSGLHQRKLIIRHYVPWRHSASTTPRELSSFSRPVMKYKYTFNYSCLRFTNF